MEYGNHVFGKDSKIGIIIGMIEINSTSYTILS